MPIVLVHQLRPADIARVRPDRRQHRRPVLGVTVQGFLAPAERCDQHQQPRSDLLRQSGADLRVQQSLTVVQGRANHPLDPPAVGGSTFTSRSRANRCFPHPFARCARAESRARPANTRSRRHRSRCVRDTPVTPGSASGAPAGASGEVVESDLGSLHADLACDVIVCGFMDFGTPARKPASFGIEPQHHPKPELRRTPLRGDQVRSLFSSVHRSISSSWSSSLSTREGYIAPDHQVRNPDSRRLHVAGDTFITNTPDSVAVVADGRRGAASDRPEVGCPGDPAYRSVRQSTNSQVDCYVSNYRLMVYMLAEVVVKGDVQAARTEAIGRCCRVSRSDRFASFAFATSPASAQGVLSCPPLSNHSILLICTLRTAS